MHPFCSSFVFACWWQWQSRSLLRAVAGFSRQPHGNRDSVHAHNTNHNRTEQTEHNTHTCTHIHIHTHISEGKETRRQRQRKTIGSRTNTYSSHLLSVDKSSCLNERFAIVSLSLSLSPPPPPLSAHTASSQWRLPQRWHDAAARPRWPRGPEARHGTAPKGLQVHQPASCAWCA
jgi:hypothetical protein